MRRLKRSLSTYTFSRMPLFQVQLPLGEEAHIMNKPYAGLLAIMLYCGGSKAILAEQHALDADNFAGTVTLTTDYMFRGISFSNSEPALQGSFDWSYGNFFAGA